MFRDGPGTQRLLPNANRFSSERIADRQRHVVAVEIFTPDGSQACRICQQKLRPSQQGHRLAIEKSDAIHVRRILLEVLQELVVVNRRFGQKLEVRG